MATIPLTVIHTCDTNAPTASVRFFIVGSYSPAHTVDLELKIGGTTMYFHNGPFTHEYTFTGVVNGTYDIFMTDITTGDTNTGQSIVIACAPGTLGLFENHVHPTTIGGTNGSISVIVVGGYAPYTYSWADGPTTLNRTGLPAGTYTLTVNSNDGQTANVSVTLSDPVGCDLTITALTVNKESLRRAQDATITVTTTTSNVGTIQYSLDNATWQNSNILTGLSEGNYTVYVRQNTCADSDTVSITRRDAKYYCVYDDLLGNVTHVELLEKNFTGTVEQLWATGDPLTIKWQGEGDDRMEVIRGSEATVTFQSDTDFKFLEIFTADNRQYRIDVYKGPDLAGLALYWTGYVLPELYSEPYQQVNYFVQLKAVDGLGMLKYIPFDLRGRQYQFNIITHILGKLDLFIPYYFALDIYESEMVATIDREPTKQAKVNTAAYVSDKGKVKNCLEVLQENLKIYFARVYQNKGALYVIRHDLLRGVHAKRLYDQNGVYLDSYYTDPVQEIKVPTDLVPDPLFYNDDARLEIQTAYREVNVVLEYGSAANLITDGDFYQAAFTPFEDGLVNWTGFGTVSKGAYDGTKRFSVILHDQNFTTAGPTDHFVYFIDSLPVTIIKQSANRFSLSFYYFITGTLAPGGTVFPRIPYVLQVGTQYWNGTTWQGTLAIVELPVAIVNGWVKVDLGLGTPPLLDVPEDGDLKFRLYSALPGDFTTTETRFANIQGRFLQGGIPPNASETFNEVANMPFTYVPDDIEVLHGDTPSPLYNSTITINALEDSSSGTQSVEWKRSTVSENKKLLRILSESIADNYAIPTWRLQASILGNYHFGASLKHVYANNRVFVVSGATFHDKAGTWQGEFLEALPVQPASTPDPGDILPDTYAIPLT